MTEIHMSTDTRAAIGADARKCDSRSLLFDRFAAPGAKDTERREWFAAVLARPGAHYRGPLWRRFLLDELTLCQESVAFAKSKARLILNGAVGVMENAGLCLDRFSGIPYIPGSAVKGCARRAAIAELAATETADAKADLLERIALVFGWVSADWPDKPLRNDADVPDLRWACGEDSWPGVREKTMQALLKRFRERDTLPSAFAGTVRFLPAYPDFSPTPDLELDVVTCHHPEYYAGKRGDDFSDNESPNPVVFPTVAPGHIFAFALVPDRPDTDRGLVAVARRWLLTGLQEYGLGAKTNAGYGWFEDVTEAHFEKLDAERQAEERRQREEEAALAKKQAEAQRIAEKLAYEARMAALTPEQRADATVADWNDDALRARMNAFIRSKGAPSDADKAAIVRALRGPRLSLWEDFKAHARGGEPAKIADAIRALSKSLGLGKMP